KLLALRLHRDHLQKIAQKAPRLERLLIENLARRVLAAVFDCHRLFVGLSPDERRELGHLFEMRRGIPRFPLFVRGKVSDSMYVVVTDYLEVELSSGLVVVAESGSVLGERSLLQPGPSDITARAPEGAVVLKLGADQFRRFAESIPLFWQRLGRLEVLSDAPRSIGVLS
ncbi:MAG: cyclic nucleotide-binding domain-containing protein, partial [Sandaracinaceae bacterium]|nr:cyclic nucleotide-binding domain-containing protein [Sandaracinaceae bacterium]